MKIAQIPLEECCTFNWLFIVLFITTESSVVVEYWNQGKWMLKNLSPPVTSVLQPIRTNQHCASVSCSHSVCLSMPPDTFYSRRCPHYAPKCRVVSGDDASLYPPSKQQQSTTYVKTQHPQKALAISNQSPSDRGSICSQTGALLSSHEPEPFHAGPGAGLKNDLGFVSLMNMNFYHLNEITEVIIQIEKLYRHHTIPKHMKRISCAHMYRGCPKNVYTF